MRKNIFTSLLVLLLLAIQNCSHADICSFDFDIKINNSYNYSDLLTFASLPSNSAFINFNDNVIIDIDSDMTVSKIIDEDFSLEEDLDVKAKKQIKPKANVIEGYKYDVKSSKCVEKVIKPNVKKYKYQEEVIGDEIENIDVDRITDIKEVAVKQKKERIAKEKKQRQERIAKAKTQKQERISWFNIFKRTDKSKLAQAGKKETIKPELEKNITKPVEKIAEKSVELPDNDVFDADKIEQTKLAQKQNKLRKKEEARITKENLKLAKEVNEKNKIKPVKIAKATEPKPIKVKEEKIKPVKVAKATEPKPIKVREEKIKPVKVAKATEPKPVKVREEKVKPERIAQVKESKKDRVKQVHQTASKPVQPVSMPVVNNTILTNATLASALGRRTSGSFDSIYPQAQIVRSVNKSVSKSAEPKPVKVREEKVKPVKVAKVTEPKPIKVREEKVKPVKVAKVTEPKPIKVREEKIKPVRVAKVTEPKPVKVREEKIKPVRVAKVTEPKPVKKEKYTTSKTVASITPNVKTEYIKPVSHTQIMHAEKALYKINKPQETPVYSAFETMQNRLPRTTKPFDSDDM